jgi:hypothetical protein
MSRALLAVPLALAALVAGCTQSQSSARDFQGEEKAVADQVEKLQTAGERGDAQQVCDDVLAEKLRDAVSAPGSNCASELDKAIKDADDYELTVEDVAIDGNQATATVKGEAGDQESTTKFSLVREGGTWRITSFGP